MIGDSRSTQSDSGVYEGLLLGKIFVESIHHMIEEKSVLYNKQKFHLVFNHFGAHYHLQNLHHCRHNPFICLIYESDSSGSCFGVLEIQSKLRGQFIVFE